MNKYLFCFFISIFLSVNSFAGPTVIGTKFLYNSETRAINVKIINDNESDYLIKSSINNNEFIVSPPLFILNRNSSNIITIIPNDKIKPDKDEVYKLTITEIPKSQKNTNSNIISIAIRSHFNVIYQHKKNDDDYNKITLKKDNQGEFWLINNSDNIYYIEWSMSEDFKNRNKKILFSNESINVKKCSKNKTCNILVNILDNNEMIIKKINLFN